MTDKIEVDKVGHHVLSSFFFLFCSIQNNHVKIYYKEDDI